MPTRKERRARSRKRRASSAASGASQPGAAGARPARGASEPQTQPGAAGDAQVARGSASGRRQRRSERDAGDRSWRETVEGARARPAPRSRQATRPQRPRPPWHPLPLAEILIVAGAVGIFFGLQRGPSNGKAPLLAGLIAAGLGTIEFTLREHLGGFRSHTVMLSLLPVVVLHSLVILIASAFGHVSRTLNLGLLAVDVAVFALLFKLLRARFFDARSQPVSGGRPGGRRR